MNFSTAALTALYPLIAFLGVLALMRYLSVVRTLGNGIRALVCSTLIVLTAVVLEQILYGYGRLSGGYVTIATTPHLVAIAKVLYVCGLVYMLYAFWLIHPNPIRWWNYPAVALIVWGTLTAGLML
jgi:hypothetical protein